VRRVEFVTQLVACIEDNYLEEQVRVLITVVALKTFACIFHLRIFGVSMGGSGHCVVIIHMFLTSSVSLDGRDVIAMSGRIVVLREVILARDLVLGLFDSTKAGADILNGGFEGHKGRRDGRAEEVHHLVLSRLGSWGGSRRWY